MSTQLVFNLILAFIVLDFVVEQLLRYLNSTRFSEKLPEELKDIYDEKEYRRSQQYLKANHTFSMITGTFSFLAILLMLLLGGFAWLDQIVVKITSNDILQAIFFFGIIGFASDILSTPFDVYDTFVIEEKFGFNKTTVKTYIFDKIKSWLLGAIIGGGLLALILWVYHSTGPWFWLIAWMIITVFSIFMTMFYSSLIVPLFNKQRPLEEGELRSAIESFTQKGGFKLKNIYVIDGSKRSTKANAYFTGIGPKKRIVLYDTLIGNHTTDELVAVLAHEIGHYKKKHTLTGLFMSILNTGILLFLLSVSINNPVLSLALGAERSSFHMGLVAFVLLYSPVSMLLGILMNYISRRNEYAADRYAALQYDANSLKNALKKLSVKNLSNLRPHPAVVFMSYSHPTLLQRLTAIDRLK